MELQERKLRLDQARKIELLISQLNAAQDDLLEPIVANLADKPDDELEDLIRELPAGFYRTEARAIINTRKGI
jgi:endonuclease III